MHSLGDGMQQLPEEFRDMTVLLVDDERLIRRMLEFQLESFGLKVLLAEHGQEALDLLETHTPDVVLMDAMMPILDGFQACARIKENPRLRDIPVVLLTALKGDAKDRAYQCGADDFLAKPAHVEELRTRILNHLRIRSLMRRKDGSERDLLPVEIPETQRVLVALQDRDERHEIQQQLRTTGRDVRTLGHLQSVLEFLSVESPDLLILDATFEDGDGLAFCARARGFEPTRELPILMVLNAAALGTQMKWFDAGASDVLVRPYEEGELLARVQGLLKQSRLIHDLAVSSTTAGRAALLDPRSGLPGRPFLEAHLEALCGFCRSRDLALTLGWIRLGEEGKWGEGGRALQETYKHLKRPLVEGASVCRIGRALFVYVFPGLSLEEARVRLETLENVGTMGLLDCRGLTYGKALGQLGDAVRSRH